MHCHHCDSSVLEGAHFCANCGHRVDAVNGSAGGFLSEQPTTIAPAPPAFPPTPAATCESCGAPALAGETLCESCFKVFGTVLGTGLPLPPPPDTPADAPTLTFVAADYTDTGEPGAGSVMGAASDAATVLAPAATSAPPLSPALAGAADPFDGEYADDEQAEDEVEYEEGDEPGADAKTLLFADAPTRAVPVAASWITAAPPVAQAPESVEPAADDVPWWERPVTPLADVPDYVDAEPAPPAPAAAPPVIEAYVPVLPPPIPADHARPAAPAVLTPPVPAAAAAPTVSYSPAPAHQGMQEIELPAVPTVLHDYKPVGFQTGAAAAPHHDPPAPRPRPPAPAMPHATAPTGAARRSPKQALLVGAAVAAVAIAIGVPIVWRTMSATPAPVATVQEYSAPAAPAPAAPAPAPAPTFDDLAPAPTPQPLAPAVTPTTAPARRRKPAAAPAKPVQTLVAEPAPLLSSSAPAVVATPQAVTAPVAAPEPTRVDAGPIGQVFELSQVDQKPQVASRTDPAIPAALAGQRVEDVVILRVLVSAGGHPAEVRVLRHARTGESLDAVAVAAVRRWSFSPARRKGQAVSCWYNVGVPFKN